jgi:hypothetical protein
MCWALEFDFSALGAMLGGIGGLVAGIAGGFLAYFAYQGLSAWKKQVRAGRVIESGEALLKAIYEANGVLDYVLEPFVHASELEKVSRDNGESESDFRRRQPFQAIANRYREHEEVFNRLRTACFHAKAVLGDDVYQAATKVHRFPDHIFKAAKSVLSAEAELERMELRAASRGVNPEVWDAVFKKVEMASSYFYGSMDGKDLSNELAELISAAEVLIRTSIDRAFKN